MAACLNGVQTISKETENNGHIEVEHGIEDPFGLLVGDVFLLEVVGGLTRDHVEDGNDEEGIEDG